ncbi:MAG TPA: hypothetical protein VH583_20400 [Vicinamibacterales bacterium]|jgi:hypothetical protein
MKRLARIVVVCICALAPATAHADDGGWWDNFWRWDPSFIGFGTDFHLACLDHNGKRIHGCEEWFTNFGRLLTGKPPEHDFYVQNSSDPKDRTYLSDFKNIGHEIDIRFGYYQNFGPRYEFEGPTTPTNVPFIGRISVERIMAMYYFYPKSWFAVGGGSGILVIHGERFDPFTRGILTASAVFYPPHANALFFRVEFNKIPTGFTATDFGDGPDPANPAKLVSNYSNTNERNFSVAVGFDLRRVGIFRANR